MQMTAFEQLRPGGEVDDAEIRIHGRRTVLERLVAGSGAAPAGVPSFVREWRARGDSNSPAPGFVVAA